MIKGDLRPKTFKDWLKLALVPALALLLLAVLFWPAKKTAPVAVEPTAGVVEVASTVPTKPAEVKRVRWPETNLAELTAFNPFDPAPAPRPLDKKEGPTTTTIGGKVVQSGSDDSLQPSGLGRLQAIYFDSQGAAALFDSKVFRVGDLLPSGDRIVEISSRGIKLGGS